MSRKAAHLPLAVSASLVVGLAFALAGLAHAQTTKSRHDLEHGASEARSRAAEARADEQALAGDIAAQSERIDAAESDLDGFRGLATGGWRR